MRCAFCGHLAASDIKKYPLRCKNCEGPLCRACYNAEPMGYCSSDCAREDQPICAAGCGTVVEADGDYCSQACYDKEQYYRRADYEYERSLDR